MGLGYLSASSWMCSINWVWWLEMQDDLLRKYRQVIFKIYLSTFMTLSSVTTGKWLLRYNISAFLSVNSVLKLILVPYRFVFNLESLCKSFVGFRCSKVYIIYLFNWRLFHSRFLFINNLSSKYDFLSRETHTSFG